MQSRTTLFILAIFPTAACESSDDEAATEALTDEVHHAEDNGDRRVGAVKEEGPEDDAEKAGNGRTAPASTELASTRQGAGAALEGSGVAQLELADVSLGLNYNETAQNFNTTHVTRIYDPGNPNIKLKPWARFIFNITRAYYLEWAIKGDWPEGKAWIKDEYCRAHAAGVKTVVNLRWEFKNPLRRGKLPVPMPKVDCGIQGTCTDYQKLSGFLTSEVLPRLKDCTDVLVIGNEPFLEVPEGEATPKSNFTAFYKKIAQDAFPYWPTDTKPLYFGSFEALWAKHNPDSDPPSAYDLAREELLDFVNAHPKISGVDLHMHSLNLYKVDNAFDWLLDGRLANDKEIIVTEFSPAPAFYLNMADPLNGAFKADWGVPDKAPNEEPITLNGDYLDYAIQKARPADEFRAWIATLGYSKEDPHYVCDVWKRFRDHSARFRLAFQGATQGTEPPDGYDEEHWPWILNPILMPITQELGANDQATTRWNWYGDVQKILKKDAACW